MKYILCLLLLCSLSCKKSDENKDASSNINFLPSVVELVDKASPSTFKTESFLVASKSQSVHTMATAPEAAEALKDFFTDTIMSISGITGHGLIRTYLKDLDVRISEVENIGEPTCFESTPQSVVFDSGLTNQTLTLKFNCARKFGGAGDQSGVGSGMAFGQDETYIYMYLLLIQTNGTDKFAYAAKVNKTTEEVDLLFLQYFPTFNRTQFYHIRTNPSTSKYELIMAGTGAAVGPAQTSTTHIFDPGVRLITNSSEIRVDGKVATMTNSTGALIPSGGFDFDSTECFSTTDLSATPATCTGSAPTFSSDMTLVLSTEMPAVSSTINTTLKSMADLIALGVTEMQ